MKIGDSKPSGPVAKARGRESNAQTSSAAAPAALSHGDEASILGIPAAEMTPKVQAAITTLMAEVGRLRQELEGAKRRLAEIEHDANQDPLVPVLNRRAFVREMSRLISFTERYNMPASVVYFDLNDFKVLNDTHGHAAGDAALLHVGGLLAQHVRESDLVGRLGGDEFGVILANATEDVAQLKADSLAQVLTSTPLNFAGQTLSLAIAYGIHQFKPGEDPRSAMAGADQAMFARKRTMKKKT
jgi:diguanylate cyclase (GGDEF)-like protein